MIDKNMKKGKLREAIGASKSTFAKLGKNENVTPRQVNYLCSGGRIPGAVKMAGVWLIPKAAEKPIDGRTKQGKAEKYE